MKSKSEIENETKRLVKEGEWLLEKISLSSKAPETERDGSVAQLKDMLSEVKKEMQQKLSEFNEAADSCQRDITKIKSRISLAQKSEIIALQKMINAKNTELKFWLSQITLLERFFHNILIKIVLDPEQDVYKNLGGNNRAKGTVGEAIAGYVMSDIFTYPDCYLLSDSYEIVNGEKRHREINSEELAYKAAVDYFEKNPNQEYVLADRPFEGGDKCAVDVVIMLISREDAENGKKGNPCQSVYFVFEAKTDSSELTTKQKSPDYPQNQAARMYKNTLRYEARKQLGLDLLRAVQDDRVHYIFYKLITGTGQVQKIQEIKKPKKKLSYSKWLKF